MAIQPIDLQALFSQIDKIGKTQSMIRDGQQIHDALQQNQIQRKLEENVRNVNEAHDMGEGTLKVQDDKSGGTQAKSEKHAKKEEEEPGEAPIPKFNFFKDPALGKNIDITG